MAKLKFVFSGIRGARRLDDRGDSFRLRHLDTVDFLAFLHPETVDFPQKYLKSFKERHAYHVAVTGHVERDRREWCPSLSKPASSASTVAW